MLKGRGRDPRGGTSPAPFAMRSPGLAQPRTPLPQRPQPQPQPIKPEPDYEVVEFPSEQYVNAKLQPPPPPPPRPPTGHPAQAGASCGLCGGGGARVRCAECGRRALCASCDDMYHRHPKRRHHQRQALSPSQLSEDRPPLPPKTSAPPVPPPRRNKMSASPKPPMQDQQRRATLGHGTLAGMRMQPTFNQQPLPVHIQNKLAAPSHIATPNNMGTPNHMGHPGHMGNPSNMGSMPFLNTMPHQQAMQPQPMQIQSNTLGHLNPAWNRPRGSLQGFNMPQMTGGAEAWESSGLAPAAGWGGMRRGASVLELGGGASCPGCAHCSPSAWRYGSCASLDHPWAPGWQPAAPCCAPHPHHPHPQALHPAHTPQPYRRADSRTMSRAASRVGSRAASPALSSRSRTSRRTKHRSPSPPLPSSDADSESESEEEPPARRGSNSRPAPDRGEALARRGSQSTQSPRELRSETVEELGPVPPPPVAPWQCEHCTYVNEVGVRVCAVCCRTPITAPKVVADVTADFERLSIKEDAPVTARVRESPRHEVQVPDKPKRTELVKSIGERTSTGCGPSPPRERSVGTGPPRLITPTREQNGAKERHDMGVGPSPPRETRNAIDASSLREYNKTVRVSPYREMREIPVIATPQRHNVSVGPSPPREARHSVSVGPSPPREAQHSVSVGPSPPREAWHSVSVGPSPSKDQSRDPIPSNTNFQKKSAGPSPPRDIRAESRSSAQITKTNVSNTGTSPPPQNISTQTYEEPSTWERGSSAAGRASSRSRRRFRDDARRERSHSRHSLSSDTRESERSVRTAGAGWEWRERNGSPPSAEWGGRLARRASHLDLRRPRPQRRSSFYGSEAASPEPVSGRAVSLEALAGGRRGAELARLLADAQRLGFDAAEVQVGLEASPDAPLEWLRSRWGGLAGAVRGAAARLAPHAPLSEREARAALARHRGAVWPAVTECVDALRIQESRVGAAARVRGRVWGSPAGADDDAAPRARAEYSSDEYEPPTGPYADEWRSLDAHELEEPGRRGSRESPPSALPAGAEEVARTLRSLLVRAGVPPVDDNALLRSLLADAARASRPARERARDLAPPSFDLIRSENDFIDAYNALTRASPLPNISEPDAVRTVPEPALPNAQMDHDYARRDDEARGGLDLNGGTNKKHNVKETHRPQRDVVVNSRNENEINPQHKHETKKAKSKVLKSEISNAPDSPDNRNIRKPIAVKSLNYSESNRNETKSPTQILDLLQESTQVEEKASNLNDIVDNTQKLIQQMKDEINSDINSLDDGHAQTSQSEHDTSSNDEREESSYSETEEETDNMSSEQNEDSNEEYGEDEVEDNSKNGASFPNRTSSEDNEQFEEALDNLDTQIEDVKHANFEILDSIARSLQEEHTMSIERNDPHKSIVEIVERNKKVNNTKSNTSKNEDPNNNLFVTVSSFDEIYAELNTSTKNIKENNQPEQFKPLKVNILTKTPVKPKILLTKHAIEEIILNPIAPTMLQMSEIVEPTFNAIIETIEVSEESDDENEIGPETVEIVNDDKTINETSNSESTESEPSQNDEITVDNSNSTETQTNIEIIHVEIEEAIQAPIISIESNQTEDSQNRDSIEKVIENSPNRESAENFILSPNHRESVEIVIQAAAIHRDKVVEIPTNRDSEENLMTSPVNRDSIENVIAIDTTNDNTTNKTMIVKSNIPKPIKPTPNIKSKVDKLAPKLIVSKVPVRRTSVKQYPAPAPPKTHFGNVQIGHVKQLQSKIFNSPKPVKQQTPVIVDVKPSTSTATLTKKKPAPPPPSKQQAQKQATPPKSSPPKEKRNNYFKETCRTEDEWTDSDSEDSQSQVARPTEPREDEPPARPSPPPPVTMRRVSGQIIDLASVQLPEGSPERQARLLLAGGALETWEQARLAVELVARGAAPPAALLAALECADLPAALAYLHQDCELCATRLPEHEMVSMLRCTHRCCRECARLYFTVQITERSIADCVCPYCKMPELESLPEDAWLEYFAHLDILLKTLLEMDVHELFQRKLRDRTLARDPNFRWCMECSSGFFVHPKQKKLRCPECRSVSCASCRKPWSSNHEGLSCEQYLAWLEDNDPERSVAAVQQHLRENGLECPRCRFKYSLSRGGCMHFTCTQCKYEFCYGCGKPFTMGARCGLSEYCGKLGLHAHHPRNCLFYLRDKEPHELQTLLQMNNVSYETEAAEGSAGRCPIQLQRETPAGLVDGVCGHEAPPNSAGLCKNHYLEYLSRVVRARGVDPLPLLGVDDLETLVRRAALRPPPRPYGSLDGLYKRGLAEIVREKIPLD